VTTPLFEGWFFSASLNRWLDTPQKPVRIEFLRIVSPLAILGFMAARVAHADEWLGQAGFRVPNLAGDARQPLYVPALPDGIAWVTAAVLVVSGLCVAAGFRPKVSAIVFAIALAFVGLSDRLAAFTVTKMSPMIALVIALSPCGRMLSVDAWLAGRRRKKKKSRPPSDVPSGSIRFLQVLLPVFYCASGIAKAKGSWLTNDHVLWTHLHDTYQTTITLALANTLPGGAWTFFQGLTLVFEALAPLWFAIPRTRTIGLLVGVGMHTMIGLMFGPVRYFAMLMISLLVTAYCPDAWFEAVTRRLTGVRK
jgi:uncharacterized membrane protein YphA (DoxX/SURF4 family)